MGDELFAQVLIVDHEEAPWLKAEGRWGEDERFLEVGPERVIDLPDGIELFDGLSPLKGFDDSGRMSAGHVSG